VAKRSPILGYNHNVRYRGLIFHVQTEDSGLMSPHLFTHLFHGGVILSTRKLVYDAGSAEDAIKGLMQAQHKVVLKDLKGGKFDDKIDQYLGGTPGLMPREGSGGPPEPEDVRSAPEITIEAPRSSGSMRAQTEPGEPPEMDTGPEVPLSVHQLPTAPVARTATASTPSLARTKTAERGSAPTTVRSVLATPPPAETLDVATLADSEAAAIAAAVAAANATVKTQMPSGELIELEEDDGEVINLIKPVSDGVPGAIGASPSAAVRAVSDAEKRSAVGAAALPPPRPIARPPSRPSISPPPVPPRPPTDDADHERPGQYSQHRKASDRIPVDVVKNERSGSAPVPNVPRPPSSGTGAPTTRPVGQPPPVPTRAPDAGSRPEQRPRTPTPARVSGSSSTPAQGRSPSSQSGGVVMTRPAVIVGAPAKAPTTSRVRKAREDEGRGFGQGLISEKSLDEVILAYLSEDSDDK
jgi:ribosomal protein L13E